MLDSQFAPPARSWRLVASRLHRNSVGSCELTALASQSDASGHIDKVPVLAQHAGQGALFDRERFTQARHSCLEPAPFSWKGTL